MATSAKPLRRERRAGGMWPRRTAERMATSAKKERTERMVAAAEDMMMITFLIKKIKKKETN
jgi:hypothetical protein